MQSMSVDEEICQMSDDVSETIFEDCYLLPKIEFHSKALELYYDSTLLTKRLNAPSMKIISLKVIFLK